MTLIVNDDFTVDDIATAWAATSAQLNWAISAGKLAPTSTTGSSIRRTDVPARSNSRQVLKVDTGASVNMPMVQVQSRMSGDTEAVVVRLDGRTGQQKLEIFTRQGGVLTSRATQAVTIAAASSYWLDLVVQGNTVTATLWNGDPLTGSPSVIGAPVSFDLSTVTGLAAALGAGVAGSVGLRHQNLTATSAFSVDYYKVDDLAQPPANTSPPAISTDGTPETGETVTCSTGAWSNAPDSYTYQWKRDAAPIPGATTSSYLIVDADVGKSITCTVTAANTAGSASATSAVITPAASFTAAYTQWLMSGGTTNTDPAASVGGGPATAVPSGLMPDVTPDQALAGVTRYRLVYVRNTHPTTIWSPKLYVKQSTPSNDDEVDIGLDPAAAGQVAESSSNGASAPAGVAFSRPASQAVGVAIGALAPGQARAVWLRRTVAPNAAAYDPDTVIVTAADATVALDLSLAWAIAPPPQTSHIFQGPESGKVGVYTCAIWDVDNLAIVAARSAVGITELYPNSGIYVAQRPQITAPGRYLVVWDTGTQTPDATFASDFTIDDLLTLTTDLTASQVGDAVWSAASALNVPVGTMGRLLQDLGVRGPVIDAIADNVDAPVSTRATPDDVRREATNAALAAG